MHPELYMDRCVLELGAGGGLPGLVTVLNGARKVNSSYLSSIFHGFEIDGFWLCAPYRLC